MNATENNVSTQTNRKTPERADNRQTLVPLVDVFENAEELLLKADMPGVTLEEVTIRLERQQLTLEGVVRGGSPAELVYNRSFVVPTSIDAEKISAELKAGVLSVHLPKRAEVRPRTVTVTAA